MRVAAKRRQRLALTVVPALLLAVAESCSLFVPFDDYYPTEVHDAATADAEAGAVLADSGSDGSADAADAAEEAACDRSILKSDRLNCGACGRACVGGGECDSGRCPIETVAESTAGDVASLSVTAGNSTDPTFVYFTTTTGRLFRKDITSPGAPLERAPTTAAGGLSLPKAGRGVIDADGGLAWFDTATFDAGVPLPLVEGDAGVGPFFYWPTNVFWGSDAGLSWRVVNGQSPAVAQVHRIASPPPVAITLGGGQVFWTDENGVTLAVPADSPSSGALPPIIEGGVPGTACLAVAPRAIVLCRRGFAIHLFDLAPSQNTATLNRIVLLDDPQAVIAGRDDAYVLNFSGNKRSVLARVTFKGADPAITLATGLGASLALALDDTYVYFANGTSVLRTTK